ncbi:MAG: HIT domain-containing protein, partial [Acidimicrobiales bacterium]
MAGCVFCEIVGGGLSAHVVLDDDVALGFLDARPLFPGHVLVVPRAHHETLADLPPDLVGPFFTRVQA